MKSIHIEHITYDIDEDELEETEKPNLPKELWIEDEEFDKIEKEYGKEISVGKGDNLGSILSDFIYEKTGAPTDSFRWNVVDY